MVNHDLDELKSSIMGLLRNEDFSQDEIIQKMESLSKDIKKSRTFFSELMLIFVHLQFNEVEAIVHWKKIVAHCQHLSKVMNRNVGLRVSMVDYFYNFQHRFNNPLLIEKDIYEQTVAMAMIDGLTGIFNRRYMELALKNELNRCQRYQKNMSVIIFDIDDFKILNDTKGHIFGDYVLKELTQYLKNFIRSEDIFCRYGGEEFVLILPETPSVGAMKMIERFRWYLRETELYTSYGVTFSAGIASYPKAGDKVEEILESADKALYEAKHSGKDCAIISVQDRRKYKRFQKPLHIKYDVLSPTDQRVKEKETVTKDVSVGGLSFVDDRKWDKDTKIVFKIQVNNGVETTLTINGKLVWSKKETQNQYAYGAAFENLSNEQIGIICSKLGLVVN